jgi:hypothetical protein
VILKASRILKNRETSALGLSLIVILSSLYVLWMSSYELNSSAQMTETFVGRVPFKLGEIASVSLSLRERDRAIFKLTSNASFTVTVSKGSAEVLSIPTPNSEQENFFQADSAGTYNVSAKMILPSAPFDVIDETGGDERIIMSYAKDILQVTVDDYGHDNKSSFVRLVWPVNLTINEDFAITEETRFTAGELGAVCLDILGENGVQIVGYTLYPSSQSPSITWSSKEVTPQTPDGSGAIRSYIIGTNVTGISYVIIVGNGQSATIQLRNLKLNNAGQEHVLPIPISDVGALDYVILVARSYNLNPGAIFLGSWIVLIGGIIVFWFSLFRVVHRLEEAPTAR